MPALSLDEAIPSENDLTEQIARYMGEGGSTGAVTPGVTDVDALQDEFEDEVKRLAARVSNGGNVQQWQRDMQTAILRHMGHQAAAGLAVGVS